MKRMACKRECLCQCVYLCHLVFKTRCTQPGLVTRISLEYGRTETRATWEMTTESFEIRLLSIQSDMKLHPWFHSEHGFLLLRKTSTLLIHLRSKCLMLNNTWYTTSNLWRCSFFISFIMTVQNGLLGVIAVEQGAAEKVITRWRCPFILFEWEHGWDMTNLWC